jgi:hypothetical protein
MGRHRPPRRLVLLATLSIAAGAALFLAPGSGNAPASAAPPLIADSVCRAHELKAEKAANPALEIEIPEEFNRDYPTPAACASHEAALDPTTPGTVQPIPFSHKHHAGDWQIDCQYCHSGTDRSRAAGVPSVELCMGCHLQFPAEYDQLSGIQTLKQHWEAGRSIQWVQIHRLPEHVKFQHQAHIRPRKDTSGNDVPGFECQQCHGPVETMDKVEMTPDTKFWPWMLPTQKLEMGWCVMCHRDNGASQDCLTCHY